MSSSHGWIGQRSHQIVEELAAEIGMLPQEIVDAAIEEYRRRLILDAANASYARLRADEAAWSVELRERALWETTIGDGIDPTERDA